MISRMLAVTAALSGFLSCGHDAWARTKPEIISSELVSMEMFMMGQYKDLDRELNRIQGEYEKGKWDSRDLIALMQQPFVAKEPEFEDKYRAWLAAYPNSYAARQARAYYYTNLAVQKLNGRKPDQLSPQELSELKHYADLAIADDSAALKLVSKPFVAYHNLISLYALTGAWDKSRQMLDAANSIEPTNTTARYQYANALAEFDRPFEEIDKFANEAHKAGVEKKYLSDYDNLVNWRLLREGHFSQLDVAMNQVQQDYEAGKIGDETLDRYFSIFSAATDPTLESLYNAWIEANPKSYAARQARALFYIETAMNARGGNYVRDTSAEEMSGMARYMKLAFEDNQAAMSLTSKPIIAIKNAMIIERYAGSHDVCAQMLALANKIDPKNIIVRNDYMRSLQTRWGGSLKDMEKFMVEVRAAGLPEDDIKDFDDMIITEKLWLANRKADEYSTIGELQTGF